VVGYKKMRYERREGQRCVEKYHADKYVSHIQAWKLRGNLEMLSSLRFQVKEPLIYVGS
jgi:hypothetical protein